MFGALGLDLRRVLHGECGWEYFAPVFVGPSCSHANSYYFDKHGDVPLRPSTTLETYWHSRTFRLSDYQFENRAQVVGAP